MNSKHRLALVAWAAYLFLSACASPQSRIRSHQAAFDSYPPEIRRKISAGQADVGFTPAQVELALGRPDRRYTRKAVDVVQEIWIYSSDAGGLGLGLGLGMGEGGYGGGYGESLGAESGPDRSERERVVFQDGAVVRVESRQK
ncbi:MAG: hypothetical protein HKL90_03290 [Elusimicrobia bacterium]|nr:hypothetical protein [Elusimicrobiota bacterium]